MYLFVDSPLTKNWPLFIYLYFYLFCISYFIITWKIMGFGLNGAVNKVTKQYAYRTILSLGKGCVGAMLKWGKIMRNYYKKVIHSRFSFSVLFSSIFWQIKSDSLMKSDYTNNYLGYWTDNGACYYYYTGEDRSYDALLKHLYRAFQSHDIPVRYSFIRLFMTISYLI